MRIIIMLVALALTGCATYKPEQLGPSKRFAVVSVLGAETVTAGNRGGVSLSGYIKAATSDDAGFTDDSTRILAETTPKIVKALTSQGRLKVVADRTTRASAAFKAVKSDEPEYKFGIFTSKYHIAPGYKFYREPERYGELAKKMNVDGVVMVRLSYGVVESTKVNLLGLIAAGTHKGQTTIDLWVINRNGETILHDIFTGTSEKSVGFVGDAANFKVMYPYLVDSTNAALAKMTEKLEKGFD